MKYAFASRIRHLQSSAVRDILKIVGNGDVISFAGGLPDDELFPMKGIEEAFSRVFKTGKQSLQYAETEGYRPLREKIIERMEKADITGFSADEVLLTTGSQQAIDLFSRIMLSPGDIVLTEDPTYLAALQVFNSYEAKVIAVDSDKDGMIAEDLEEKIKKYRPKCIYVVPTFSNPAGRVWSLERRKLLIELVQKHHIVVLEDNPYGELQFQPEETYSPLAALDNGKHVLYTSTFSKIATPGLRTGWIVGPYQVIRMMAQAKQANDLHSDSVTQQALYQLMTHFDLDAHIQQLITVYKGRMEVMLNCLERAALPDTHFIKPKGGMFFWVEVEKSIDTTTLLNEAVAKGVAYVPGEPFFAGKAKKNTMRLNFTYSSPEKIEEGMNILVELLSSKIQPKMIKVGQ